MPIEQEALLRHILAERVVLVGYIRSIVRDRHLAEDVYQDVSILAVKKIAEIPSLDVLPGWLRRAARFEALNAIRKQSREHVVFDDGVLDLLDVQWSAQPTAASSDMLDALDACMDELTDNARRILQLRYREELTGQALADALGKPKNTVYVAMSRAHTALAECVSRKTGTQAADTDSEGDAQ